MRSPAITRLPRAVTHLLVAALSLSLTLTAPAKEKKKRVDYTTYNGFTMSTEPVLPAKELHPSLWFRAADLDALRAKKDADETTRALWKHMSADPLLTSELPPEPKTGEDNKALHEYYGKISMLAKANALMSLLGQEPERDGYAARAIQALKRAYDGPLYGMDPTESGNASDEIYRAVWAQNYAAAYDWVQPRLSSEEDAAIRARLIKEARTIAENLHEWTPRPHNHLSKPAWGLGSLALALSSEGEARAWLGAALEAANQNTKYFFSADGIYREGGQYLVYSAINFVPFLYHYKNVAGVDGFTQFQPVFETVVATRNSRGWLPNIYDSFIRPFPSHMVAPAYQGKSTWLNPEADLAQVLQWHFRTTDFGPFTASKDDTGFDYTGASWDYEIELDEYLTYDPAIRAAAPSAGPTVFLEGGQTVFRNAWAAEEKGQRYLLFHGVARADNHFHFDLLSFVIQAEGQMMASDSGYSRKSYGEAIRKKWYLTPAAHNVVTADGDSPEDPEENVTPTSRDRLTTSMFQFEEKEAPYPNGGLQKRAIAMVASDYFVVIDQLSAPQKAAFKLHLHGGRGNLAVEGNEATWTYAKDEYGPAARMMAWTLPATAQMTSEEGEITYIKGDYGKYGYITAEQKSATTAFMQVILPQGADAAKPAWQDDSNDERLAAVVTHGGAEDTHMARMGSAGTATSGEVNANARYTWVRKVGGAYPAWALQEGRELVLGGKQVFTSSEPVMVSGQIDEGGLELTIASAPEAYTVTLPGAAKSATFNGQPVQGTAIGNSISYQLSGIGVLKLVR